MSVVVNGEGRDGGELTLAFSLSAARRLSDPAGAFAEAREWSRHVGVVGNDADEVAAFVDDHGLQQDYDPGDRDKWLLMEEIREETHTPRHMFVGTNVEDRRIADYTGWEFEDVTEAAEKADWELAGKESEGLLGRLLELIPGG
jgi:hypothetical protein